jgi:cobalamin-dependent methionine synthase I
MHEEIRKHYWGYAKEEQLTIRELHNEQFQGIRPAVGYPSLPDQSINFILDELLNLSQIGITLSENGAMRPHCSVSGLIFAHPKASYFSVGNISEEQLRDYANRRNIDYHQAKKFLATILRN